MYFFLSNLSFAHLCYTNTIVPQMLIHLVAQRRAISFLGCAAQIFVYLWIGGTQCVLLAVMVYD